MKQTFNSHRFYLAVSTLIICLGSNFSHGSDATLYAVCKRQIFSQTNSAAPVPHCCPFMFNAMVALSESNSVRAATATAPSGVQSTLSLQYQKEFLPRCWMLCDNEAFPTREMLDAARPSGEYRLSIFGASD